VSLATVDGAADGDGLRCMRLAGPPRLTAVPERSCSIAGQHAALRTYAHTARPELRFPGR
jgi:hypothetical protein